MSLTHNQCKVLAALSNAPRLTQREIAERTGLGLATVNAAYKECQAEGLIDDGCLTDEGASALKPYAVENAVILAASSPSRFVPISYERPNGLLRVRGEVLIERQIEQLRAAGIRDIVVVVGYKKESFFYLEEAYGVTIVIDRGFTERASASSLALVRERLGNTYVCSADDYFEENPFESHVWKAYCAAQRADGATEDDGSVAVANENVAANGARTRAAVDEGARGAAGSAAQRADDATHGLCAATGARGRITKIAPGASPWCLIGHAYFDRAFSARFAGILERELAASRLRDASWEDLLADHVRELDMLLKRYDPPIIHEFESLDEVRDFDPAFLENLDSEIFDNIAAVLGCDKADIHDVYPLKQGITNLSCHFATADGEYVYRHPGVGTELIVDRRAEQEALKTAKQLGLDDTFIFEDPSRGWKVSRFVPDCANLNAHDDAELKVAMEMARRLHECGVRVSRSFSFYEEGKGYERTLLERGGIDLPDYWEMSRQADRLNAFLVADGGDPVLCHNDFFGRNFLVAPDGEISLIDWEYAGMSDYANDFGTFSVCDQLTEDEMRRALAYYFGRTPTDAEWRHNLGQVGMAGWCWYAWSLLKESEGEDVGEWAYIYYRAGRTYLKRALDLYDAAQGQCD